MPSSDTPIDRPTTLTTPPGAGSHRAVALEIKFQAPTPVASQVVRKGLCDAICNGVGQLVLVRAPAGFGKTTAMVQARERLELEGVATVWLTLDRAGVVAWETRAAQIDEAGTPYPLSGARTPCGTRGEHEIRACINP